MSIGKMFREKNFTRLVVFVVILVCLGCSVVAQNGSWQTLLDNAGISSMHTAVTRYDTAIMLDRTNVGASQILLPNGICRNQPLERILKVDCSAHSVMFDPLTNTVRPLLILTDTWCSSGGFMSDGSLVQTGGDYEGRNKIRTITPCTPGGTCDWVEDSSNQLTVGRWYASNHVLPDGQRMIVVGGRSQLRICPQTNPQLKDNSTSRSSGSAETTYTLTSPSSPMATSGFSPRATHASSTATRAPSYGTTQQSLARRGITRRRDP